MLKKLSLLLVLLPGIAFSQVGVGTNTPNASAVLDVTATNKGFLPPRIALTGTNDASTISSPATGLMVFNTATAGTATTKVTPGLYYYEGSKWQRVINQQPDATVSFNAANPNTSGTVFTPNTPSSSDYIYVSATDNSQWTWNNSTYVAYTPPASTAWTLSGTSNDAGSNKAAAIGRTGKIGIGNNNPNATVDVRTNPTNVSDPGEGFIGVGTATNTTANAAGSGAIRYNTTNKLIEFSNGTSWQSLSPGNTPMYAQFSGNAYQTLNTVGTVMNFPTQKINVGSITFSGGTNFTLPAGRKYRVDLNLGWMNGGWLRAAIFNSSTNAQLSQTAHIEGGSSYFTGSGTVTTFIETNSVGVVIDVRLVAGGGSVGDPNNGTNFPSITIQTVD